MIRLLLTSALLLLVLTSAAFGQFTFDFKGTGARAQGMGNAFLAISDDASAASWNPAGLVAHSKLLIGFDIGSFKPEGEFINSGTSFKESASFSSVNQLSIIAPFRLRGRAFVGAFSYGRSYEEYFTLGGESAGDWLNSIRDTTTFTERQQTEMNSAPAVINFALGTVMSPELSIGASVNIYTGQSVTNSFYELVIPHYINEDILDYVDTMRYTVNTNDSTKFSGVNLTFAGKYTSGELDFGLVIKTPFDLMPESDAKSYAVTTYNGFVRERSGTDGQFPTQSIYRDNILIRYEIPWIVGFGMAYHASEDWLLAADVEYRGFSGQQIKVRDSVHIRPTQDNIEFYTTYDLEWRNSITLRVGTEYLWHTGSESFPIIPLRIGAAAVPLVMNELNTSANSPSIEEATQYRLSAGFGVKWSQIFLDVAISHHYVDMNIEGYQQTYKGSGTDVAVGFTGYF